MTRRERTGQARQLWAMCVLALASAAALVTSGCGGDDDGGGQPAWIESAAILVPGVGVDNKMCRVDLCPHHENTDLITWNGAIWLVHRSAVSQILGPNSALHVYKSTDSGVSFVHQAKIDAPVDRDIRDPHFYIVGSELHLKALTRLPVVSSRDSDVDTIAVNAHSSDGVTWSALTPIGPPTWSFWNIEKHGDTLYTAAYEDGDKSVVMYSSTDGLVWTRGALVYGVSADTPLETELVFMPSGKLLALVRMDGTDEELLGGTGRLRTKVCWADPPYAQFACPDELTGQRLDGPVSWFWNGRLFVLARKHIAGTRKRTALFEITGTLEGGPIGIREWGEVPSAGDTAYGGVAALGGSRFVITWYSGELARNDTWGVGILRPTDIWKATLDLSKLE